MLPVPYYNEAVVLHLTDPNWQEYGVPEVYRVRVMQSGDVFRWVSPRGSGCCQWELVGIRGGRRACRSGSCDACSAPACACWRRPVSAQPHVLRRESQPAASGFGARCWCGSGPEGLACIRGCERDAFFKRESHYLLLRLPPLQAPTGMVFRYSSVSRDGQLATLHVCRESQRTRCSECRKQAAQRPRHSSESTGQQVPLEVSACSVGPVHHGGARFRRGSP